MLVRKTTISDVEEVVAIYEEAKHFMKEHDNPTQWDSLYPSKNIVLEDIEKGNGYVVVNDNKIIGVFALIFGDDPTYQVIKGSWLNNHSYATIHRIAARTNSKGTLKAAVDFALTKIDNIRIDTHEDNYVMKNALAKLGFVKCGIIYLPSKAERVAFQYVKKDMK